MSGTFGRSNWKIRRNIGRAAVRGVLALAMLSACAGPLPTGIKLSENDRRALDTEEPLRVVHYRSPSFLSLPANLEGPMGTTMGVLCGAPSLLILVTLPFCIAGIPVVIAMDRHEANEVAKHVVDPTFELKNRVLELVWAERPSMSLENVRDPLSDDVLAAAPPIKGLVLDFKTIRWGVQEYFAQARLIRIRESRILWQGVCQVVNRELGLVARSEYDDKLKLADQWLRYSVDLCARDLFEQLNEGPEPPNAQVAILKWGPSTWVSEIDDATGSWPQKEARLLPGQHSVSYTGEKVKYEWTATIQLKAGHVYQVKSGSQGAYAGHIVWIEDTTTGEIIETVIMPDRTKINRQKW